LYSGLKEFGHTESLHEFNDLTTTLCSESSRPRLILTGFRRPVELAFDPAPAIAASQKMLVGMATHPYSEFAGKRLVDISKEHSIPQAVEEARTVAAKVESGILPAGASETALLMALMELCVKFGPAGLRKLLARARSDAAPVRKRRAAAGKPEKGLPFTRQAIVEGLILGQILERRH